MKIITNKQLTAALLRGAVVVSGSMATFAAMLFTENVYALFTVAAIVASCITLIISEIK